MAEVVINRELLHKFKEFVGKYTDDEFWKMYWDCWFKVCELDKKIIDKRSIMIRDKKRNTKNIRDSYLKDIQEAIDEYIFLTHYIMAYRDDIDAQRCAVECATKYGEYMKELRAYGINVYYTSSG